MCFCKHVNITLTKQESPVWEYTSIIESLRSSALFNDFDNITKARRQKSLEALVASGSDPMPILILRKKSWDSASRPFRARGADGIEYIVKARQKGRSIERQMVNDQIVARLGMLMGAPVGRPSMVDISQDLIDMSPNYAYVLAGIAHSTEFIKDCSDDRELFLYTKETTNRERFALLCILYSWVYARDHQFIYSKMRPNLVYSVDHGHFFIGGPDWTIERLAQAQHVEIDPMISENCNLTIAELESAARACLTITEDDILNAVAAPPSTWNITIDDRLALVEYLISRQKKIIALFPNLCYKQLWLADIV